MSHVIIVSNRLPVSVTKKDGELVFSASIGGMSSGLSSYISGSKNIWVGWPGIASEELTEKDKQTISIELAKQRCAPVWLTKKQVDEFYNGYSNQLLWPICHDLPVEPTNEAELEQWWKAYRNVNKIFADAALSLARPDSTIWVHDYQLLLLPKMLRAEHTGGKIGFFFHIPFPDVEAWTKVHEAKQLLIGMLGADVVGFHTTGYCQYFIDACEQLGLGEGGNQQVITQDRTIQVTNFPIGVDYDKYARAGKLRAVKRAIKRYKLQYGRRKVIVAVDRLEPSKGLLERLKAYRDFLAANPKLHNKVVMVMVAAPSRTDIAVYQQLRKDLKRLAASINKRFGTKYWQPLDLIVEPLQFEQVSALYRLADIAFIAPLRDGMNLVAKEYVASKKKRGILILSETAGAAEELEGAILVDPTEPKTVVTALEAAFSMPKKELRGRLKLMQQATASNTIHNWANTFVKTLNKPVLGTHLLTRTLKNDLFKNLVYHYKIASKRLVLLDYDGSLVAFSQDFKTAKPPQKVLDMLRRLQSDPLNEVVLVSGRTHEDLDAWFGHLPISLVSEHGASIKKAGNKSWQTFSQRETKWKQIIKPILQKYVEQAPKAELEIKPHSLVWHYRSVSPYYAQKYAVTIKRVLKPIAKTYGLQLFQGNKILEIKDPRISKGAAIRRWLKKDYDFVLVIGDDFTDEDMFEAAPAAAYTVKVGRGRTAARFRLTSVQEVHKLLRKFTK